MSRLDELIAELCPDGVPFKKIKEVYTRIKGTPITASKMKEIEDPDGEIRIFAGGKTVINAREHNIPNANITRVPAILVQSRGVIDAVYYDKPFTFKNEMWAYTNESQISVKYLYYVLKNNVEYFRAAASGMGSLPQISLPVTEDFIVPVPPLPVQQEIVRILDHFTELTAELQKQLDAELTARKKHYEYYLEKLLLDQKNRRPLSECCETIADGDHQPPPKADSGIPFITIGNINNNRIDFSNSKYVPISYYEELQDKRKARCGDILYSVVGSFGIPVHIYDDKPFVFQRHIAILRPNHKVVNSKYLYYCMKSLSFYAQADAVATGAAQRTVGLAALGRLVIPIASIEEQKRIVSILDRFDSLCNDLSSGLPAEIAARQKQYEYYRDKLLTFKELKKS